MDYMVLFTPSVFIPWLLAILFGIVVGATPGLSATMAVVLIIPVSYYMPPLAGLAMVLGVSCTAILSGDIPATYIRVPGTGSSAAAVLDGYEMHKRGKGGLALSIDIFCSAIGGVIGVLFLIFLSPYLAALALRFTHFQYFWLGVFGLLMGAILSKSTPVKGIVATCLGLLISTVGTDISTGYNRFTFGILELADGVVFSPVMIGLFGVAEILVILSKPKELSVNAVLGEETMPSPFEVLGIIWRHKWLVFRSALIGVGVGALPGAGGDVASWVSYGAAKETSKNPDKFGTGTVEGVIAPTSANNAAICSAWIPALVFGIPGDSITAVVLGAMMMYGLAPGPQIFVNNAEMIHGLFFIALISQFMLIPAGYLGVKAFRQILKMPKNIVFVLVAVFALVGSFSIRHNFFDIYVMLFMGVLGYFMRSISMPQAPLVLGVILGPIVENNLRVGMLKSRGNLSIFFTDPICAVLITLILLTLFGKPLFQAIKRIAQRRTP